MLSSTCGRPKRRYAHTARPAACKAGLVSGWLMPDLRRTTVRETKRARLMAPALQTPPNFPREDTQRDKKSKNRGAKFWAATLRCPTLRAPFFGVPLFLGLGPHPFSPSPPCVAHLPRPTFQGPTMTHTRSNNGLDKVGLAQIGQIRMAKTGLAKVCLPTQTGHPVLNRGLRFYLVLNFWLAWSTGLPVLAFQHVYLTQIRDGICPTQIFPFSSLTVT